MSRRIPGWVLLLLVVGVFLTVVVPVIPNRISRSLAESESFRLLTQANTPEELREAVGSLGLFLELPDGSWIAIRYRDSHAMTGWSSAVALDSDGAWFISHEHFCGRFKGYRLQKENEQPDIPRDTELHALETSESLAAARAKLYTMGFRITE
jgi:hypothetical protein